MKPLLILTVSILTACILILHFSNSRVNEAISACHRFLANSEQKSTHTLREKERWEQKYLHTLEAELEKQIATKLQITTVSIDFIELRKDQTGVVFVNKDGARTGYPFRFVFDRYHQPLLGTIGANVIGE